MPVSVSVSDSEFVNDALNPYWGFQAMFHVKDVGKLDALKISVFNHNQLLNVCPLDKD